MERDKRYKTIKNLISTGSITTFREIFDAISKTRLARDMGTNYIRLNKLIDHLEGFALKDFITIAELIDIDLKYILDLVYNQYVADKKGRRKK
jgi:hypothetical protein